MKHWIFRWSALFLFGSGLFAQKGYSDSFKAYLEQELATPGTALHAEIERLRKEELYKRVNYREYASTSIFAKDAHTAYSVVLIAFGLNSYGNKSRLPVLIKHEEGRHSTHKILDLDLVDKKYGNAPGLSSGKTSCDAHNAASQLIKNADDATKKELERVTDFCGKDCLNKYVVGRINFYYSPGKMGKTVMRYLVTLTFQDTQGTQRNLPFILSCSNHSPSAWYNVLPFGELETLLE